MKNIIITGTSRGIGLELAKLFGNAGHQVLALSRNDQPCQELQHPKVHSFSCDLSQNDSINQVVDYIKTHWQSQVDILINNAGMLIKKPFAELTPSDVETVYKVNIGGVFSITQATLPFMKPGSHVVNISSIGGIQGSLKFPGLAAYSSSKGALNILTEVLSEEYKESGIAFNALALGAVQTEMLAIAFPGYQAPISAVDMAQYIMDFSLQGNRFYNGKILQVSTSTP
jgi:3-oxoacyl-[acyl-carrier protein] reductase